MSLSLLKNLGIMLLFAGSFCLVYFLFPKKKEQEFKKKLEDKEIVPGESARFVNMFRPFFSVFLPIIKKLPLSNYKRKIEKYAVTAGIEGEITGDDFIGFQIITALLFGLAVFMLFKNSVFGAFAGILGLGYPYLWLYEKKKKRQEGIVSSMPDVVDMLSLSVEAGLDFNAGLIKVCDIYGKDNDPFVAELSLMRQNMKLGRSREEALRNMADRVDTPELHSFVSILIQAEKMGSSISYVLESQAKRMRQDRFMKAERIGTIASQKLLVPMMLLIFPIIFIVIFGPYILKFIYKG
jgi:tight adherence protein C